MAAVAGVKQAAISLPKIPPISHSSKRKASNIKELSLHSQPVAPTNNGTNDGAMQGLPTVRMSMDGTAAKPRRPGFGSRSLTDVGSVSAEEAHVKRSELKSSWLKANDVKNPFKYTVEELNEIVQEKISSGFHGLRHLFKSHTANGNGLVSREALQRILIGVCGYISKDLFDRYLKRLGLQHAQYISFQMFMSKFPDNEVVRKEWLMPIQQAKMDHEEVKYPEKHFRHAGTVIRSSFAPASFFMLFLKDLVKKKRFKPEFHLPKSVVDQREEMLRPQLRSIVIQLTGYSITDNELDKLWMRFDSHIVGSVPRDNFYKVIGYVEVLDEPCSPQTGSIKPADSRLAPQTGSPSIPSLPVGTAGGRLSIDSAMERVKERHVKKSLGLAKRQKNLQSVVERVIYPMELPSMNLAAAFEQFDLMADNFLSKIDFRRVLREFGFPIGALDLETFLARNNLRVLNDLIEYKEFIRQFTSREDFGLANRIVNDELHVFNTQPTNRLRKEGTGIEGLTAEELEAGLVEYLMGSYISLISFFRNSDTKNTKFLPIDKVKPVLEKILERQFKSSEWKHLLSIVGVTDDGLIPYENIIAVINNRRPCWNQTSKLGHQVTVLHRPATTVELERLRGDLRKEQTMHTHLSPLDHLRSLDDMSIAIRDLMKTRFRSLDYAYRYQDRKMTGRLDKHMLQRILKECGLEFEKKEMDKLWSTFALAPDGLYTWSKFCQRYINDLARLKAAAESEDQREENYLTSADELHADPAVAQRPTISRVRSRAATTRAKISDPVLAKLQPEITAHASDLESLFTGLDCQNRGYVTSDEAVDGFKVLKIRISPDESRHVCKLFDLEDSSKFHYRLFLSSFKSRPQLQSRVGSSKPVTPAVVRPSSRVLQNRLVKQLQGRGPEMRRQFKKSDPLGQGVITLKEFKLCLGQLGVDCAGDDSFSDVTSLFDHTLRGQINYEEFTSLC